MENRDRDKVSQGSRPTDAGSVNRETSEREGRENDSSADFGQSIGRSEELNNPDRSSDKSGSSIGNIDRSSPSRDRSGRSESDH
jgi:hypothetical protein